MLEDERESQEYLSFWRRTFVGFKGSQRVGA
jgi:hypothetical protein